MVTLFDMSGTLSRAKADWQLTTFLPCLTGARCRERGGILPDKPLDEDSSWDMQ